MPERVTIAWLWHNVPPKLWLSALGVLFAAASAAFVVGYHVGQNPNAVAILKGIVP